MSQINMNTQSNLSLSFNSGDRKIMLFDLDIRGHHAGYIQHLITYWRDRNLSGTLDILVVPEFIIRHESVVELTNSIGNINFITITLEEEANLKTVNSSRDRFQRSFQEWQLIKKYTQARNTTHCLLMFFDAVFWRMCFGVNPPCPISGIFFRPISHYCIFTNYKPSLSERFWELREKLGLSRILSSGYLQNCFCLDSLAVDYFAKLYRATKILYPTDPVQIYDSSQQQIEKVRHHLGIEPGRKVFLLFGSLSERKGIYKLLEAIKLLSADLTQKLCLLLVGPIEKEQKDQLAEIIKNISYSQPVQIVSYHQFIIDSEIQPYFEIADVILAPYQRHVGMSAIIVRAAAANKPVLSSNYGLMGEITRINELGLTVDSNVPQAIAEGLTHLLTESADSVCNYTKMKHFAEQNRAERFAEIIFENILV